MGVCVLEEVGRNKGRSEDNNLIAFLLGLPSYASSSSHLSVLCVDEHVRISCLYTYLIHNPRETRRTKQQQQQYIYHIASGKKK